MSVTSWSALIFAGTVLAGISGASAQTDSSQPGHAPGMSTPAPSVDTGNAGTRQFPVRETSDPKATGTTGNTGSAVNPPAKPPGTITPGPKNALDADVSGRNPCYPGQSGQPTGSTNP